MTVLEILKTGAQFLGLFDEFSALNEITEENESTTLETGELKALYNMCKFSIQEFCSNYVPIVSTSEITTENCEYSISDLTNYLGIKTVEKNNEAVNYKIINRKLVFNEDGTFLVRYYSYPSISSVFTSIEFEKTVWYDVLVIGLCAYYSLSKGMFEEFEEYHNEYVKRAENFIELKNFNTPMRRWEWKLKNKLN